MDINSIFNNSQNTQQEIKYKYLLLGDCSTTLYKIIKIFTEGSYNQDQLINGSESSILPQLSYREGTFNDKLVRMEVIFDPRITKDIIYSTDDNIQDFFNGFNAFIIVYDTTDIDSFNGLPDWLEVVNQFTNDSNNSINHHNTNNSIININSNSNSNSSNNNNIFLVGENCNKRLERRVPVERIRNFAINNNCCGFIEISTQDNKNIDNIFIELTNILVNQNNNTNNTTQDQQYPPPKLSPIPKDSILDTLFKISVISASAIGLFYFLKSK